ncbi:MAG: 1-deoxy-D-xylulose-5-phosphate synthase, partial [Pelotomaculum thermopropionicum]
EVLREGKDVTLLALGSMVCLAEKAAEDLAGLGIKATVVNARFVKPLDRELILHLAERTGRILTVEEHVLQGGFGSAVLELLNDAGLNNTRVQCAGIPDTFVEHGKPSLLMNKYGLTVEKIVKVVMDKLMQKKTLCQAQGGYNRYTDLNCTGRRIRVVY